MAKTPRFAAMLLALMMLWIASAAGETPLETPAARYGQTTAANVNLRAEAGVQAARIGQLAVSGTYVVILGEEGSWYQVEIAQKTGYIRTDLLEELSGEAYEAAQAFLASDAPLREWAWVVPGGTCYHKQPACSNMKCPRLVRLTEKLQIEKRPCAKCW